MESENRRKYYRAKIVLPIQWEVLGDEEKALVQEGKGASLLKRGSLPSPIDEYLAQAEPGSEAKRLYRCLQLINNKLNFVIERLVNGSSEARSPGDAIEISGSGLKFITDESLSPGSLLRMNLLLPESFHFEMELLAEVVRVDREGDRYLVASDIVAIDEDYRDAIIQAVFKKQRQEIRNERNTGGGEGS